MQRKTKLCVASLTLMLLIAVFGSTVFAAGEQPPTMILAKAVAESTYTIHIPSNATLEYGNTEKQEIGEVYVTGVRGFDKVTVKTPYTDLINTGDPTDTIPLVLYGHYKGTVLVNEMRKEDGLTTDFARLFTYLASSAGAFGYDDNGCIKVIYDALVSDWSGATAGATYQAVVTFEFVGK